MSPLKLTIFVVCLTVGIVVCLADESQDQELEEENIKVKLAEADSLKKKDEQKNKQKDHQDDSDGGDEDKSRKKRQVYNNGYVRTPYLGYPLGYNPLRSFSRLSDVSYTFDDLPMFQFFNSFYNAGAVRSNGLLVRHYLRTGTTYNTAYQDFGNLPLRNVRQVRTDQTRVVTTVNNGAYLDYEGELYGFPDVVVRLQGQGCYLDGYTNLPGLPCIRIFSNSNVFGRVRRNLIYLRGFTDTNPFFVAGK